MNRRNALVAGIPEEIVAHPKNLTLEELRQFFIKLGEKPYRANQLYKWWHEKEACGFDAMSDISRRLRENLKERFKERLISFVESYPSSDGSEKLLFETLDNKRIETVYLPEARRRTLCVSTQIGCPLACKFCRTGEMGLIRNLSTAEILEQVYFSERKIIKEKGVKLTNLVFMGMGEPLLNYENVIRAAKMLIDEHGRNFSRRHLTISTAGITDEIARLFAELPQVKLALSVNAPMTEMRRTLMPVEKKYPIKELIETLKQTIPHRSGMLTVEYVMIKDVNDRIEDAENLSKLLKGIRVKINLIALNEIPNSQYKRPAENVIFRFQEYLIQSGFSVFIRASKGEDISAACGMLGSKI